MGEDIGESQRVDNQTSFVPGGDATENVQAQKIEHASSYLELQVVQEGQREFRFPFIHSEIDLKKDGAAAFPDGTQWSAKLKGDGVVLSHSESGETRQLRVGENTEIDSRKVWLIDSRQPSVGRLEGVTETLSGRTWHIKSPQSWLGRRGKRLNHIELDDPTISRAHASLVPNSQGQVDLLSESAGSATTVNGEPLAPGKTRRLQNGDLLGFGQLNFRFMGQSSSTSQQGLLNLQTLGGFKATLSNEASVSREPRNEKARWLLAYLGSAWGKTQPVEGIIERFWPDIPVLRGRKNLSYTVGQLKDAIGLEDSDGEPIILRTPSTIGLNPERLGTHDFIEVQKLAKSQEAITSPAALTRFLELYKGPFLASCYDDWADVIRTKLEVDFVQTLLRTAEKAAQNGEIELLEQATKRLNELDPIDEQATLIAMDGYLKAAKPELAVAAYEQFVRELKSEGLEPSTEALKQYYRASMGI